MASIPLPALDIRPPAQQPDPLEQYGRLMQLKQMQTMQPLQQQAAQQNVQSNALGIQQQQQQLTDQKAMTSAMQNWDGKDYNDILPLVLKNGGSAQAVMGLKQKILEQQQSISTTLKNNGDAAVAQMSAAKTKSDYLDGALSPLIDPKQTPDAMLPQAVTAAAQSLVQKGVLDPQHAQQVNQILQMPPDQIRQQLTMMRNSNLAQSQIMEDGAKQAGITKDVAQAGQANAAAQKDQMEIAAGGTGAIADSRYRNIVMAQKLGRPVSADDQAWAAAYQKQKTLNPVTTFNLQNSVPGGAPGGTPGQPSALAKMVASGDAKWGDVISPRTPQSVKEAFAKEVQAVNPNFSTSTYAIETKAAEKATSGTWADTRLAYNTALDHSQLLMQAATALQNGDVQALNSLKNKFGTAFGATGPITFNAIANAYNHEVTSVVAKGHMTDKEVETGGASLPANASLPQIQSVVGAYNSLMSSKRNELDKMIKAGAGNKANGVLGVGSDSAQPSNDPFAQFGGKAH